MAVVCSGMNATPTLLDSSGTVEESVISPRVPLSDPPLSLQIQEPAPRLRLAPHLGRPRPRLDAGQPHAMLATGNETVSFGSKDAP